MYYFKIIHTKRTEDNQMQQTQSTRLEQKLEGLLGDYMPLIHGHFASVAKCCCYKTDVSVFIWLTVIYFFI